MLELMIPPTKRPGNVAVTRPYLGSNPGLVILFSLTFYELCPALE